MKLTYLMLPVFLLSLSGCASQGSKSANQPIQTSGTGTLIIKPIKFKDESYIRGAVKEECNLDGKLSQFIKENAARNYATILTDTETGPADAKVLKVTIDEVQGAAGGAWSGPKIVTITGSLSENGKELGDFKARRYSGGGMFGAYKGTCAILGRCVKTLGRDVAEWMTHPTEKAVLGDM